MSEYNFQKKYHFSTLNNEKVIENLSTCLEVGLTEKEAQKRIELTGHNEFKEEEKESIWEKLYEQFDDPMVKLLLLAAIISFSISLFSNMHGLKDELPIWIEPLVIFLILIANGLIALYQDYNSDKSVETLKNMQSRFCNVLRNGIWEEKETKLLTIGDVVKCQMGEVVPADIRVMKIESQSLKINQAILNGESIPVNKTDKTLQKEVKTFDQGNILFSGTFVLFGKCLGVVCQTGENTEIGKIKLEIDKARKETEDDLPPLKKQLNNFGEFLAYAICVICLLIWILSYKNFYDEVHGGFVLGALYYFKQAVALGVAAIPEGLPAVITTCLALGTRRMIKRKALIRKLPAVETLGCTTVICSDKTGTLTKNEMIVSKFCVFDKKGTLKYYNVTGSPYSEKQQIEQTDGSQENLQLLTLTTLKNTQSRIHHENGKGNCIGLPTEGALMALGYSLRNQNMQIQNTETLYTLHFTNERKMMSVLVKDVDKKENYLLVKGAAEIILENSVSYLNGDGKVEKMDKETRIGLQKDIIKVSNQGYRVLGISYKKDIKNLTNYNKQSEDFISNPNNTTEIESETTFLGFVCIEDPIKDNVKESMDLARQAGITVFMITGDYSGTALAIAKQINLVEQNLQLSDKPKRVFLGEDLDCMEKEEMKKIIKRSIDKKQSLIFARTTPANKREIVSIISDLDEIVAMTGDGVNDAPALKQASIGIAMGIHGTDVAKEASDMILIDDNFASIISAVEEGRSIYANMKAFIRYMISSNIGEVISIFITSLLGIPEGFNSIQLLWVNLVTDGLPATALSFNKPDPDVLKKPPRKSDEKLVDSWIITRYMIVGLYVGAATVMIFVYYYCYYTWSDHPHTIITFQELTNWTKCSTQEGSYIGFEDKCDYFFAGKKKASTLSLTVLVMIEMFNALNAMSEDQGLMTIGIFNNLWLWAAILISTLLHCLILYIPFLNHIFSTAPLDLKDWILVLVFTLPVIFIEEVLKYISRRKNKQERLNEISKRRKIK